MFFPKCTEYFYKHIIIIVLIIKCSLKNWVSTKFDFLISIVKFENFKEKLKINS